MTDNPSLITPDPKFASSTAYIETIEKLEPDIAMIDAGAFYASAAISLKRIADKLEYIASELTLMRMKDAKPPSNTIANV